MGLTDYIVPLLLAGTAVCALARRVDVYAALTAGAGEGLRVMARICPALIGLLTAVGMFRASGAMDALAGVLAPLLRLLGIPPEMRRCCSCGRSAGRGRSPSGAS